MNIVIFDTETTSLEKPFCYNIGYKIVNTESRETLCKREYVVEQIWANAELFSTAYYATKRQIYVNRMRAKQIFLRKYGHITQQMIRDFETFEVVGAYAYNSSFDEKVFNFNSEWFKVINPFETLPIFDIRGYVHQFIAFTDDFQTFCENNLQFTEGGNYSTTAETLYRYISGNMEFNEEHTALTDSEIETEILFACIDKGAEYNKEYKTYQSIPRKVPQKLIVVQGETETEYSYTKRTNRGNKIFLK